MTARGYIRSTLSALAFTAVGYIGFLATLTIPSLQTQAIYLSQIALTWFQDVNQPMQWGFLPNQVTPFYLETSDGQRLHSWHVLPLGLYQQYKSQLLIEPTGAVQDFKHRLAFKLLRDDPQSLLVLYLHGAAGTLGSGWRPASYRAMHAMSPTRIHTIAIDYRGFGESTGYPSEKGLLIDARTLLRWAMEEAQISPDRIVIFAHSIGTAVALSLAHDLSETEPVSLKGMLLVAPFTSVEDLSSTYSIAGTIPLLAPLTKFPSVHTFFKSFLICKWPSKDYLASLLNILQKHKKVRYDITIMHAKDDWDIPWSHSDELFWGAVEAFGPNKTEIEHQKTNILNNKQALGSEGWSIEWKTSHGVLRQEIVEHGLHDRIMSYPWVSQAIWRAFQKDE